MGAVETLYQPRLAACGEFPSCACPPAPLGILTGLVGKRLMLMGGLVGGAGPGDVLPLEEVGGPRVFVFSGCESSQAVAGCCCGCSAGACSRSKVRASCPTDASRGNVAVPPRLAEPLLLVIYQHQGFAVARSSLNPPTPSSQGPSSAVQR